MSAFLGPIHHRMYRKIQFQNELVDQLIAFAAQRGEDIAAPLDQQYGTPETAPLEDVIDTSDIHGWLQQRVSQSEYRLAAAVGLLLDRHIATEDELGDLFHAIGARLSPGAVPSAPAAFRLLDELLLDGMPCDRANELLSEQDAQVVWRKNVCVHTPFWEAVGGGIERYDALRARLMDGLLGGAGFAVSRQGNDYTIERKG